MIVVTSQEIASTSRNVSGPGWQSRRMIVREHGMGHSVHETRITEGSELHLHYKNHFESNYCIEGEGEVQHKITGEVFPIRPGTIYSLNENDPHILRATKGDLLLVCVFTPPLAGNETHNADGSYASE
ncbi:ectoine synthase [Pseudomonas protegens]|uniref:ectoine synthase n=1 Tax=Pseudomonas protegens TaxID=380021 RepID=UPI00380936E1